MDSIHHMLIEFLPKSYIVQRIIIEEEDALAKKIDNTKLVYLVEAGEYCLILIDRSAIYILLDISEDDFKKYFSTAPHQRICDCCRKQSNIIYACNCQRSTCLGCRLEFTYNLMSVINSDKIVCRKCLRDSHTLTIKKDAPKLSSAVELYAYLKGVFYSKIYTLGKLCVISKEFARDLLLKINKL